MIFIAGLALGLIGAVIGYRRGFYAMWATTFNVIISIYIAVMLTPTVSSYFAMLGNGMGDPNQKPFWYIYAICVAAIGFFTFLILEVVTLTYFTGMFNVTLPKLFEYLGSLGLGFITGYVIWGFICFVVLIMPFSQSRLITKAFTSDATGREISTPAISKLLNTTNVFSWQPNSKRVNKVISWTLGWDMGSEKPANIPQNAPKQPEIPEEDTIQI